MALKHMTFQFQGRAGFGLPVEWSHTGVVGSGDLEIMLYRHEQQGMVTCHVCTPVDGFEKVWEKVLSNFVSESRCGNLDIEINDNNATPFIVKLRLRQALTEASGKRRYDEVQKQSFYDSSARERAAALVDEGTFTELVGPKDKMTSPHLPNLKEAVSFDDGVVCGIGKLKEHPVFVISQEGKFIGGAVGEVHGAKMVGTFQLALQAYEKLLEKDPEHLDEKRPIVVISFETGGVRLHEANAGLLAHAEVMDMIQNTKGKVPVVSLIGSKVGCFGGMGFVAAATDVIIMSPKGRLGLTGPEVIEQELGKEEFDASDKSLISRTTGGKHKYIMRDCNLLVDDTIGEFRNALLAVAEMSYEEICKNRRIGSYELVKKQMDLVALAAELNPSDAMDMWKYFGNTETEAMPEWDVQTFLDRAKRRTEEA